jgi:hypothetical protein
MQKLTFPEGEPSGNSSLASCTQHISVFTNTLPK